VGASKRANGGGNLFSIVLGFGFWATTFDLLFVRGPTGVGHVQTAITSFYTRTSRRLAGLHLRTGFGARQLCKAQVAPNPRDRTKQSSGLSATNRGSIQLETRLLESLDKFRDRLTNMTIEWDGDNAPHI
jgi:hypothetical protein